RNHDTLPALQHSPGLDVRGRQRRRARGPLLRRRALGAPRHRRLDGRPRPPRARRMRRAGDGVLRRQAPRVRPWVGARRHAVPAPRVGRDRAHPVRRDAELQRARRAGRRAGRLARRRRRHRPQPAHDRDPVPSRRRRARRPHGVRGRHGAQGGSPHARGRAAGIAHLRAQDLARLVALAAMWGASYLFLRYAAPFMGPVLLIELRVALAGAALLAFALASGGAVGWRRFWREYLFVGAVGLALPFTLIAQAVTVIDASTAAILNALAPLFASVVAAIWIRDPLTPAKLAGIGLCLAGTAVLVGWTPVPMSARELLAASLSVAATALYGYTIVFTKVHLREAKPLPTAAATLLMAAAAMIPFTPVTRDLAAIPMG